MVRKEKEKFKTRIGGYMVFFSLIKELHLIED